MASRAPEDITGDQPPSKRPRTTKTDGGGGGDEHKVRLLSEAVPVLVENNWAGVKELGRLEQTCKAAKLTEDTWAALCFLKWPSTKRFNRAFFTMLGGYRIYCRKRMAKPLIGFDKEQRKEMTPYSLNPATAAFMLDVYVNGKSKLERVFSFKKQKSADYFQRSGGIAYNLKDPVVLGSMTCFVARQCICGGTCIGADGRDFSRIHHSLSLIRKSEFVTIGNPESSKCSSFKVIDRSKIRLNDDGRFQIENGAEHLLILRDLAVDANNKMKRYEKQGLAFRRTAAAYEIKRRVEYHPVSIFTQYKVDVLPCSKKYGITNAMIYIGVSFLKRRSLIGTANTNSVHDDPTDEFLDSHLFGDKIKKKFDLEGVTPFHILEQLESNGEE